MKFRLVVIGISAAVMVLTVACSKEDIESVAKTPETFAESTTVDISETEPVNVSDTEHEEVSVGVKEKEALVEIVTGKSIQQTLVANETKEGSVSETKAQEVTIATETKTHKTMEEEQKATAETTTTGTSAETVTQSKNGYSDGAKIGLNSVWKYAEYSVINSGTATMYLAKSNRKDKIIGINAGHGTAGGTNVKTWCHPDKTAKVTGGTTSAGATQAVAVSTGMNFSDGTKESTVTLKEAQMVKSILLERGYDVLMIRDGDDVQLDNVARTVICNNVTDCHIAIHWDGDGLDYDKGCFYMSVPDGIKYLDSVAAIWQSSEALGNSLIAGLKGRGCKIFGDGTMDMDLTQTSYSTVPSIDIELGNQSSDHSDVALQTLALGIADGVENFFE